MSYPLPDAPIGGKPLPVWMLVVIWIWIAIMLLTLIIGIILNPLALLMYAFIVVMIFAVWFGLWYGIKFIGKMFGF